MIKLIDLLEEIVSTEARLAGNWHTGKPPRLGNIYHNTSFKSMAGIIKDGLVLRRGDGICFSRAKRFWKDAEVRIVIDGKKFSQKYDIMPHDWGGDYNEWEERCDLDIAKAKIGDCIVKVLLKPKEETTDEWVENYMIFYTKEHNKAIKKWPEKEKSLRDGGYSSKEIKQYFKDDPYLRKTPEEERKHLLSLPHVKKQLGIEYRPQVIKGLKEKGVPFEITDNFPAHS